MNLVHRFHSLVTALSIAVVSICSFPAAASETTAIIVSALHDPVLVKGRDGMDHLEYDLLFTNVFFGPVTLSSVEALAPDGRRLLLLEGDDLLKASPATRRRLIGAKTALVPQDPLTALNPSRRIGRQITDRLVDILGWDKARATTRALEMLAEVRIQEPERVMRLYPHELSGGMRQRVLIAAAFAAEPKLIVADEPTTALDVTVQKQTLRLISELQARHGTALLFVTHDLGVVAKICDRLSVLYAGKVVEDTSVEKFFATPAHPYSAALLAATPRHTDPTSSLRPVPAAVLDAVGDEIAATDAAWRPHG